MSIMHRYIKCKRNNCFERVQKAGKYKLFEYTESPNVFSDERLQSADSAGGHDSSQHQRLSLERNIYFQINPFSLFFFFFLSFYQDLKENLSKGLCRRKSRRESQHYQGMSYTRESGDDRPSLRGRIRRPADGIRDLLKGLTSQSQVMQKF